ncbi:MAG: DUF4143 domain-containing protein [Clostridiales bacterium]|jgi:predicted AAA+ superfamily ATPase|nr:DUF4143 domain-containing protein [Clostridiales bacterium]
MAEYIKRLIDDEIALHMKVMGAVAIEGPKWCGKSTTGEQFAKTIVKLQRPDIFMKYKTYAYTNGTELLAGEKPLMFDEWQKIPEIWDYVRADIDSAPYGEKKGRFILTGSVKPIKDKNRHSGTGRIAKLVMRPMSLWESGESTGDISLKELFDGRNSVGGDAEIKLRDIANIICRGGWPESVTTKEAAVALAKAYFVSLINEDINEVDGIRRNPKRAAAIIRAYARNISTFVSNATLLADIAANDVSMDAKTLSAYLLAFEKLYVIEDIPSWSPRLRSAAAIRAANKRQFVDPSIAAIALEASPQNIMDDLKTFGFLFESLCERDLRIYVGSLGGYISHYHDKDGLEIDSIAHLNNGKWGAIEIKLGGNMIDDAAKNLLKLKEKVDTAQEPSFLMVLSGIDYAYKRPDGVLVVPIGCLKN